VPANTPEQIHALFEAAFNAQDIDSLMTLYEPEAAIVPQPGAVAIGIAPVREALLAFLALNGTIRLETNFSIETGDLALMSGKWSLKGTGPDGKAITLGAVTAEVARRQPDGAWLYVIDHPWGDQVIKAD
jgi:ketosteroid isomerase-like protein